MYRPLKMTTCFYFCALIFFAAYVSSCTAYLPEAGLGCPCSNDYICCPTTDQCLLLTEECPQEVTPQIEESSAFISLWSIEQSETQILLQISEEYDYDFTIDWGDGSPIEQIQEKDATHLYLLPGTYRVSISGQFPLIQFQNQSALQSIVQWGDQKWLSMHAAFENCTSLQIQAIDTPDLSQVEDMESLFAGAKFFNSDISSWNVSHVKNMSKLFLGAEQFNQDLNNWDLSSAEDISLMFYGAKSFNHALDQWNVSKVENMQLTFAWARSFNQPVDSWNVSHVKNMSGMFWGTTTFNQSLHKWQTSQVTDMSNMFNSTAAFNQNLNNWDISQVTDMHHMFTNASTFDQNLAQWNIQNIQSMDKMFSKTQLSTVNYDAILQAWSQIKVQKNVIFDGGKSHYCTSVSAREQLLSQYNWVINDRGYYCE